MAKKKYTKKKKNVSSNLSDDNSAKAGITTSHGSTVRGRPQSGGNYTNGHIIHSISPPGTGHQAPGSHHQSPVTGHPGIGR